MNKIVIGTRGSILALWQANFVKDSLLKQYPHLKAEIKIVTTKGDKILDKPLTKIGGKGLFTKELQDLMFNNTIDIAVHSLKDVPVEAMDNLILAAITKREDVRDSFLSIHYPNLESLPYGAKVGTTSLRRTMQLKKLRNDLDCVSLRGNVQTRLERLKNGNFDAIILAQAGINRLQIHKEIRHILPLDFMIPAMGQAALGIECKANSNIFHKLSFLNDKNSLFETTCEREFVKTLEAGCQTPIGVNAVLKNNEITLKAILGLPNGEEILQDSIQSEIKTLEDCKNLGKNLALKFISLGAKKILQKAKDWY
ncbi:MAG: hydroxymethylbilane synthase [Helicobacter sp.]|nr:hydroxymethylbilane synthase [Helicobacter sp.]